MVPMSDWDLIEKKAKVPRNDPKVDRHQSLVEADTEAYHIRPNRVGGKVFHSPTRLSRDAGVPSRKVDSSFPDYHDHRNFSKKQSVAKTRTPKEKQNGPLFREYRQRNQNPSTTIVSDPGSPDPILLNLINIAIFLVAASLFSIFLDVLDGIFQILAYVFLWFGARSLAGKLIAHHSKT